jgi:hypothetical protein
MVCRSGAERDRKLPRQAPADRGRRQGSHRLGERAGAHTHHHVSRASRAGGQACCVCAASEWNAATAWRSIWEWCRRWWWACGVRTHRSATHRRVRVVSRRSRCVTASTIARPRSCSRRDGGLRRGNVVPLKATVDKALENTPSVAKVIVLRRLSEQEVTLDMKAGRDLDWHELWRSRRAARHGSEIVDAEHPLFILYTSGSTGKPESACCIRLQATWQALTSPPSTSSTCSR